MTKLETCKHAKIVPDNGQLHCCWAEYSPRDFPTAWGSVKLRPLAAKICSRCYCWEPKEKV